MRAYFEVYIPPYKGADFCAWVRLGFPFAVKSRAEALQRAKDSGHIPGPRFRVITEG